MKLTGITKIPLDEKNRMLRTGLGKHEGRWFARVDLWWAGFRFTGWPLVLYIFAHLVLLFAIFGR